MSPTSTPATWSCSATSFNRAKPESLLPVSPPEQPYQEARQGLILLILLVLLLVGALPRWGHSANWGYGPSGILGIILIVVLVLFLMGRL